MDTTKDFFVIAVAGADDAVMFPINRLLSVQHTADDVVSVCFPPGIGDSETGADAEVDKINITVGDEGERAPTLEVIDALNSNYGKYRGKQANYIVSASDVAATPAVNLTGYVSCAIARGAL